jgi:hypothetical protein
MAKAAASARSNAMDRACRINFARSLGVSAMQISRDMMFGILSFLAGAAFFILIGWIMSGWTPADLRPNVIISRIGTMDDFWLGVIITIVVAALFY